jgi:hypothetical protein
MVRRNVPPWVFVFGRDDRYVALHDPACKRDEDSRARAAETHVLPLTTFSRLARNRPNNLTAALLTRKGPLP